MEIFEKSKEDLEEEGKLLLDHGWEEIQEWYVIQKIIWVRAIKEVKEHSKFN